MLKREEAATRLTEFLDPNRDRTRAKAMQKLSARAFEVGRSLFSIEPNGERISDWQRERGAQAGVAQLRKLPARDRQQLFGPVPALGPHVESAYQLFPRLPYQRGGSHRYFRAPSDDDALSGIRFRWLNSLADTLRNYDPDVAWCAAWASFLGYSTDFALGPLLAAAIDSGGAEGDEVFEILRLRRPTTTRSAAWAATSPGRC